MQTMGDNPNKRALKGAEKDRRKRQCLRRRAMGDGDTEVVNHEGPEHPATKVAACRSIDRSTKD